jgi:hypothetical protein
VEELIPVLYSVTVALALGEKIDTFDEGEELLKGLS